MALRAIYEKGQLRLLGNEKPTEGQEFTLVPFEAKQEQPMVIDENADYEARVRAALGDLVTWPDPDAETEEPEMTLEEIWSETAAADQGQNLASRYVIEEREQGY